MKDGTEDGITREFCNFPVLQVRLLITYPGCIVQAMRLFPKISCFDKTDPRSCFTRSLF
jgi:hypothetical protein